MQPFLFCSFFTKTGFSYGYTGSSISPPAMLEPPPDCPGVPACAIHTLFSSLSAFIAAIITLVRFGEADQDALAGSYFISPCTVYQPGSAHGHRSEIITGKKGVVVVLKVVKKILPGQK
jgi:hypothetical protein